MNEHPDRILRRIESIRSLEDEQDQAALTSAVDDLFQTAEPQRGMEALFQLFERFPESEAYALFWGILQRLETLPGYEQRLVESVRRQPGWFNVMMIQRLMNAGRQEIEGIKLLTLLEEVVGNPRGSALVRKDAQRFVEWQRRQAPRSY